MSLEILLLGILGAAGWYWFSSLRVRERAIAAGRRASGEAGVQFLDDTVALTRTRLTRNSEGRLQFARRYRFEFSDTGDNRRPGHIEVVGERVESVEMDGDYLPGQARVVSIDD